MNHREGSSSLGSTLVVVAVFLIKINILRIPEVVEAEQCMDEECLKQASRLTESIDMSVDPCEDFVEFACGKAFAKYERMAAGRLNSLANQEEVTINSHTVQLAWIRQKLIEELNQPYRIEEHRAIGLAKMYWQSCRITSAEEALAGVRILLKRLGGWPMITEKWQDNYFTWDKFSKCARLLGFLPRMFIHVGLNDENVEKPWYANDTIELTIERSKYMADRDTMNKMFERANEYFKIAERVTEQRIPDMAEIDEALQFGKRIHAITYVNEMPVVELKVMTIAKLQKSFPFVDWMDYIRSMLTRKQANYLSDRNCVIVDVCYMSKIGNILETTEKRVQANYAFLSIVDDLSLFIRPQLSLTMATSQEEVENICFDSVIAIFRRAMEMILAKLAGQRMRQRVNEIWTIVYNKAREMFQKIPWMDHQTQLQATKKSEKTTFVNLFPDDIFEDRYFDRLEFSQPNATLVLFREVNVFLVDRYYLQLGRPRNLYIFHRRDNRTMFAVFQTPFSAIETRVRADRVKNTVYIPAAAAILQDELAKIVTKLDAMVMSSIGLQIADALGQLIHRQGSFVDVSGHWREASWWSKTTQRQFASRPSCVEIGKVKPVDEISTIFGLIGAAEIAYKAMFESVSTTQNTVLPGFGYSTKQLFWIFAVASECDRDLKRQYNAMVAHNIYFADDFSCPKGSKMNPIEKCKMWLP